MMLYFSIYEYDYYNNAEPTGATWAWDNYFTEKPRDFEKVLRTDCGIMLECCLSLSLSDFKTKKAQPQRVTLRLKN